MKDKLRQNSLLLKALIYRLSRCLVDSAHNLIIVSTNNQTTSDHSNSNLNHSQSALGLEEKDTKKSQLGLKMIDFPYTSDNFTLFSTICRTLYLFDIYSLLEAPMKSFTNMNSKPPPKSSPLSEPISILVSCDIELVEVFAEENELFSHRKRDEIESIDDIHINLLGRGATQSSFRSVDGSDSANSSFRLPSPSHGQNLSTLNTPRGQYSTRSGADEKGLGFSERETVSERIERSLVLSGNYSTFEIEAIDLLNYIAIIVLTIGPYYWSLYVQLNHNISSAFYTGNLINCEEAILQLLMLPSDAMMKILFTGGMDPSRTAKVDESLVEADKVDSNRYLNDSNGLAQHVSHPIPTHFSQLSAIKTATPHSSFAANILYTLLYSRIPASAGSNIFVPSYYTTFEEIMVHRRLFLANSLVRILISILQKLKTVESSERASILLPIIVSCLSPLSRHLLQLYLPPLLCNRSCW